MTTISLCSNMSSCNPFMSHSSSLKRQRAVFSCKVRARAFVAQNVASCDNYYQVLALTPDVASPLEIKRAYRSMARRYHPDACHDPSLKEERTRIFVQLHEAYETLSDPILRQEYDYKLSSGNYGPLMRRSGISEKFTQRRWQEQIVELSRRSKQGKGHREGSWGSRMRALNME